MNAGAGGSAYHATDGAAYEVFLGRWTRRLADPLLDFARFPAAGRLLDVGCGTGSLACAMAARWPARNVVGIDIAAPYIAFARSQAAGLPHRALARETVIAQAEIARLLRATVRDLQRRAKRGGKR